MTLASESNKDSKMADRVKQTAEDELKRVQALAKEAAVSGAYLYPLRVRHDHFYNT